MSPQHTYCQGLQEFGLEGTIVDTTFKYRDKEWFTEKFSFRLEKKEGTIRLHTKLVESTSPFTKLLSKSDTNAEPIIELLCQTVDSDVVCLAATKSMTSSFVETRFPSDTSFPRECLLWLVFCSSNNMRTQEIPKFSDFLETERLKYDIEPISGSEKFFKKIRFFGPSFSGVQPPKEQVGISQKSIRKPDGNSEIVIAALDTEKVGDVVFPRTVEFYQRFRFDSEPDYAPIVHRLITVDNYFTPSPIPSLLGDNSQGLRISVFDYRFRNKTAGNALVYTLTNGVVLKRADPQLVAILNAEINPNAPTSPPPSPPFRLLLFLLLFLPAALILFWKRTNKGKEKKQ